MLAVPDRTGDRALYSIVKELDDLKNLRPQRGGHGDPRRMSRKWREHSYEEPVALATLPKHNEEQYERRVSIIYVPPLCEIPATPAMRKSLLRPISLSVRSVSYTNKLRRKFSSASGTSLSRRSTTGSSNRFGIPKVLKRTRTCVVCQSAIDGTRVRVPCGHYLDIPCFMHLVDKSAHDESLFPPSCCRQAIPDRTLRHYLPPPLIEVLADKGREFSATKRVYCSNPPCSRFLGPRTEDSPPQVLTCTACTTQTCSACRERMRAHKPHRCGRDRAQRELLALANQKGWARCPACEHMIELRSGCYHMTCICATQFCYLCRSPWKTCDCPQWEVMQLRDVGEGLSLDRPLSGLRVALRTETAAKKPESKADRPKRSGQTVARPISRVQSEVSVAASKPFQS
ncbi:hypothetical protein WOLCODRAFT_106017 [Wolfiporia cocos MD-104 SS10]|uniref:RBR-type E3 ubiquitin transferase n=1 Tax=Wolfiporia cocos (strain MD-104) TaxID=742152 RepID=A0A2H3K7J2_WOLCO|nr:hypothetical protein WOLCODRAFT_106017 [Wolfiporia cocos MD-104 SS10]